MRSVTDRLNFFSKKAYGDMNYRRLEREFSHRIRAEKEKDEKYDEENLSRLFNKEKDENKKVKEKALKALGDEGKEKNKDLPSAGKFETYQEVKMESEKNPRDVGLKNACEFTKRKWKEDRDGSYSVGEIEKLEAHYKRNYPKSAAKDVLAKAASKGYSRLNRSHLARIASSIRTQRDYDRQIKVHGLDANSPMNIKARKFILSIVNS
jgi:hypothetical protein